MISNNRRPIIIVMHFQFRLYEIMLASKSRRSQLRQRVHLSLHYHERTVSALVWQEAVDEVESLYPRPSRSPPMKIQRGGIHGPRITTFPVSTLPHREARKLTPSTILIAISFQCDFYRGNALRAPLRLIISRPCIEIETLLVSPIDNIVMTEIVFDCYLVKCFALLLISPYSSLFSQCE